MPYTQRERVPTYASGSSKHCLKAYCPSIQIDFTNLGRSKESVRWLEVERIWSIKDSYRKSVGKRSEQIKCNMQRNRLL